MHPHGVLGVSHPHLGTWLQASVIPLSCAAQLLSFFSIWDLRDQTLAEDSLL